MSNSINTAIKITDGFSPALKGLHNALSIVTTSLINTQRQFSNQIDTSAINQARTELARVSAQFDTIANETEQARQAQERYNQSLQNGNSMVNGLWGKVKGLVASYATYEAGKFLIQSADAYGMTISRIDMMNDGLQTTEQLEKSIRDSANRTYSSFSATADAVGKLGINASEAFNNTQDVVNFVEQINKHMAIAGTKGAQAEGAWIQLTQAMSNGVLRGDELQSVLDGMPTVAQAIKEEFSKRGVAGSLKEIAEQGLITSDIVKTALYNVADETNAKFEGMQTTFGDLWNLFRNKAEEALTPVFKKLNSVSGSETAKKIATGLGIAVGLIAKALLFVMNVAEGVFNLINSNMFWLKPLFMAIAGACLVWGGALAIVKLQAMYASVQTALLATKQAIARVATLGLSGAMAKLSAVMAINPMTLWIIAGILLVGVFYGIIAVINKVMGTSISATGIIFGAFAWLGSVLFDVVAGIWNYILNMIDNIQNAVITVAEVVYNAFNGGFGGWIDGVKSAFWSFIDWALSVVKPLIEVWDKVKGTNYASSLQASVNANLADTRTDDYKTFDRSNLRDKYGLDYRNPNDDYSKGYKFGENLAENFSASDILSKFLGKGQVEGMTAEEMMANAKDKSKSADGYGGALDDIAKNTGATAKNTSKKENDYAEEMKFMRELGQREAINRFTTAQVSVTQNNSNNMASAVDSDSVISRLMEGLREAVNVASER